MTHPLLGRSPQRDVKVYRFRVSHPSHPRGSGQVS
jgi:hypothetical protein